MDSAFEPSSDSSYHYERLDDIEKPAWTSVSLSESCGSHLSHISSLCSDFQLDKDSRDWEVGARDVPECVLLQSSHVDDSPESSVVPSEYQESDDNDSVKQSCMHTSRAPNCKSKARFYEDQMSAASSTKTLYASPESSVAMLSQRKSSRNVLDYKSMQRRGSLYRERAPSENALDFGRCRFLSESKSQSLHDVSQIAPLKMESHSNLAGGRCQSRDSGFIHSESLLSLNSGSRNYDHVQSKVKMYIQNIKDADAVRRQQRRSLPTMSASTTTPRQSPADGWVTASPEELSTLVEKLKNDMDDKDRVLGKLQEDYDELLRKYAEAENRIDKLRFNCIGNSPSKVNIGRVTPPLPYSTIQPHALFTSGWSRSGSDFLNASSESYPPPSSPWNTGVKQDSTWLGETSSVLSSSVTNKSISNDPEEPKFSGQKGRKEVIISAPLGPITKLYSTSVRLDRPMVPLCVQQTKPFIPQPESTNSFSGNRKKVTELQVASTEIVNSNHQRTSKDFFKNTQSEECCDSQNIELSQTVQVENRNENLLESNQLGQPLASSTAEPMDGMLNEDPFMKVQRWQNSLPPYNENDLKTYPKEEFKSTWNKMERDVSTNPKLSPCLENKKEKKSKLMAERKSACLDCQTAFKSNSVSTPFSEGKYVSPTKLFRDEVKEVDLSCIVPRLNLDGLSDENEGCNESLLISDCGKFSPTECEGGASNDCDRNSFSQPKPNFKVDSCVPSSQNIASPPLVHICKGHCKMCGKIIHADQTEAVNKKLTTAGGSMEESSRHSLPPSTKTKAVKRRPATTRGGIKVSDCHSLQPSAQAESASTRPATAGTDVKGSSCNSFQPLTLSSTSYKTLAPVQKNIRKLVDANIKLGQLFSSYRKEQDHVVPSTPKEAICGKCTTLNTPFHWNPEHDKKLGTSKTTRAADGIIRCGCCCCHQHECSTHSFPSQNRSVTPGISRVPSLPEDSPPGLRMNECGDSTLLQCLDEMDEYATQMWAKTVSFLEVLESNKHSTLN